VLTMVEKSEAEEGPSWPKQMHIECTRDWVEVIR